MVVNMYRSQEGRTPLHLAVLSNKQKVCSLLVARGASPDAVDKVGKSIILSLLYEKMEEDELCMRSV